MRNVKLLRTYPGREREPFPGEVEVDPPENDPDPNPPVIHPPPEGGGIEIEEEETGEWGGEIRIIGAETDLPCVPLPISNWHPWDAIARAAVEEYSNGTMVRIVADDGTTLLLPNDACAYGKPRKISSSEEIASSPIRSTVNTDSEVIDISDPWYDEVRDQWYRTYTIQINEQIRIEVSYTSVDTYRIPIYHNSTDSCGNAGYIRTYERYQLVRSHLEVYFEEKERIVYVDYAIPVPDSPSAEPSSSGETGSERYGGRISVVATPASRGKYPFQADSSTMCASIAVGDLADCDGVCEIKVVQTKKVIRSARWRDDGEYITGDYTVWKVYYSVDPEVGACGYGFSEKTTTLNWPMQGCGG